MSIKKNKIKRHSRKNKRLLGALMMLLHSLAMSITYILNKKSLVEVSPGQLGFLIKLCIMIMILPWCLKDGFAGIKTKKIGAHLARGAFAIMGKIFYLQALVQLTATDAAAIAYFEGVIVSIIGFLYFKERLNWYKSISLICCVASVMMLLNQAGGLTKHHFFIFAALLCWAVNNTFIKVLGRTEKTTAQLFYMTVASLFISAPLAAQNWQPVDATILWYIVIAAVLHMIHTISFFKAYKFSDISAVMPIDYSRLLFIGVLSYVFLAEIPHVHQVIAYCLVFIGGVVMFYGESKSKKKSRSIITVMESKAK